MFTKRTKAQMAADCRNTGPKPPASPLPADPVAEAPDNASLAPVKHRVNGRTKTAIDIMVWEGARRDDAALKAGITIGTMRNALRAPHVKAYYREQLDVLRESERAKNIHRAIAIRDAADNMPAMHAIKWLEGEQEQTLSSGRGCTSQSPGVTFVIVQQGQASPSGAASHALPNDARTIDVTPQAVDNVDE